MQATTRPEFIPLSSQSEWETEQKAFISSKSFLDKTPFIYVI